jgi:hypothetical protein
MMASVLDTGWAPWLRALFASQERVTVGIHDADTDRDADAVTNAQIGCYHEYGVLKTDQDSDSEYTVPERSFMRSTFDENRSKYLKLQKDLFRMAALRKISVHAIPAILGAKAKADIQAKIRSGIAPALKESTRNAKVPGSDRRRRDQGETPLIAGGELLDSIGYEVDNV